LIKEEYMRIVPADKQVSVLNGGGYRRWLSGIIKDRHDVAIDWDDIATDAPPVYARVSRGDWVASCDVLQDTDFACGGSMVVTYTPEDAYFYCDECCNVDQNHKLRPVAFPPETDRLIIEELLTARPHPALRYYHPSQSVTDIKNENSSQFWLKK
jgi:hypothetical protein